MTYRVAHKRKVNAKKFGRVLVRYTMAISGTPFTFPAKPGSGKNTIHHFVVGVASQAGRGRSIISMMQELDNKDGGNRLQTFLSGNG
ncbi:hypothetical protein NMR92_001309 [Vibrio cholerae]|nr:MULTISPECIES: hypothetical protein [Vibrio]EJL6490409.1 hypothetical protein [Vibrio cholerae]EJL6642100.1 hypothetical protein [Vibrio cholerae]MBL4244442.1 hypothetical protein [Vibrio fluvialis]MBL4253332.1 hypothetical protein [Vibrio fluvialis]MCR9814093.1 hypothetical protein [Vibrio parahaemolyticus]